MSSPPHSSESLIVGFISPGWPAEAMPNGVVSYTATMVKALRALGVNSHVLASHVPVETHDPFVHKFGIKDHPVLSKIMWRVDHEGWLRRVSMEGLGAELSKPELAERLDVIELEEAFGVAGWLRSRIDLPLVVRLHGPWFLNGIANGVRQDRAFRRRDRWERRGLEAAAAVSAPSRHVLEQTRAHFNLPLPDASVIPNPVEPVAPENRWRLQDADRKRVAFVGRFDRHKGGDLVLEAFKIVLRQVPDARLDFVGPDRGVIDENGRTWKIEQYLQQKLSPAEREKVTFHGFQPGPAAAEIRKRALVTVAPSRYETFGIAAAEAMMAGCPLVVGAAGALPELVQHDRNGLVAQAGRAEDLAAKIVSLLENPEHAARLGEQAAMDAAERYSPGTVARQTLNFYQELLRRRAVEKKVV